MNTSNARQQTNSSQNIVKALPYFFNNSTKKVFKKVWGNDGEKIWDDYVYHNFKWYVIIENLFELESYCLQKYLAGFENVGQMLTELKTLEAK